jgi:CheY-like chemotaxis protein
VSEPRILVVDDDPLIRSTLTEALSDEGYHTIPAEHGRAALAAMEQCRPDLILLDLMMPELDGIGFRREQRRRPHLRDIPVVVLSASQRLWLDAAMLAPAAVLEKPFGLDALLDTVAAILNRRSESGSDALAAG